MREQLRYSTWIRSKKIATFWLLAGTSLVSSLLGLISYWFLLFLLPGLVLAYIGLIVTWTHFRFSSSGGDFQNRIHDLLLSYKRIDGETLDIGCGNGNLIIKIAKRDRNLRHVGLDYWGKNWEYSVEQCRTNARIEGADNVDFVRASATKTGLADAKYAYVVSCLTFHEVVDEPDRTVVLTEALRVLKPGGTYIFLDLFDDERHFGKLDTMVSSIEDQGCMVAVNEPLNKLMRLPFPLNGKKVLRHARLISGRKATAQ